MGNNRSINAICILDSNEIKGNVYFHQCNFSSSTKVKFYLKGTPLKTHAIHIHEYGDLRKGCTSLGPHYNPNNTTHGSILYKMERHAGDLINNIVFDENGKFEYEYEDSLLNVYDILGRSVVIHEKPDDLGLGKGKDREESLKTGNAGNRICCAIIALSEKCDIEH
jgi:Cu-Zn family superoxide dismutase